MRRQHAVRFSWLDDEGGRITIGFVELWEPGYPHEIYVRASDVTGAIASLIEEWDNDQRDAMGGTDYIVTEMIAAAALEIESGGGTPPYGWDMEVDSFNVQAG